MELAGGPLRVTVYDENPTVVKSREKPRELPLVLNRCFFFGGNIALTGDILKQENTRAKQNEHNAWTSPHSNRCRS